jgi:hypothetical protein
MATTTNYGWTTPDDTALVKDGAAAIRTLGSSIDTTTKNLNPETTLADLAYRSSTANVKTRLGIGSTGQVLTVAGGVPTWATPAAGSRGLNQIIPTSVAVGSGTASVGANGMITFTTVGGNLSINGCFTSAYTNYAVVMDFDNASSYDFFKIRMRASGTDNTTASSYIAQLLKAEATTVSASRTTSSGWDNIFLFDSSKTNGLQMTFFRPFEADSTAFTTGANSSCYDGGHFYQASGNHDQNTSYDGFSVIFASTTITGKMRIYGWQE